MQVRVKKINSSSTTRMESVGEIRDVLINEDLLHPERESVSVCFRGENTSGIVDFTPQELENVYHSVKKRMKLIKGFSKVEGAGKFL